MTECLSSQFKNLVGPGHVLNWHSQ